MLICQQGRWAHPERCHDAGCPCREKYPGMKEGDLKQPGGGCQDEVSPEPHGVAGRAWKKPALSCSGA